jgi:serine protease inhibitor
MNEHLRTWLNEQTGGLLEEQSENTKMEPSTVFALASTLYFAAGWDAEFSEKDTADSVFHAKNEDLTVPFMNQTDEMGVYYWGENFGAVCLYLTSGSMWLILPDEGKTVEDVLASSEYLEMTRSPADWKNKKSLKVNLSMPKFDISSQADLIVGMKKLGLTDVFISSKSDFSPMTDAMELYVSKIDHAVRVAVDEEGVLAAAYTVIMTEPGGVPSIPDDEIDFVLDRPFMFVVSSRNALPLFTGVVEQP